MKLPFILIPVLFLALSAFAQSPPKVYTIPADSTKLTGCDSNELIIENHTQAIPGFLWNTGRGRTIFKRPLTKISDTFYLVGQDTLKVRYPNAWLQGGNRFGTTGVLGTLDNNHLDFYTNNQPVARLDNLGNFLLGTNVSSRYKLDVVGETRITSDQLVVTLNNGFDNRLSTYNFLYGNTVGASGLIIGSVYAYATVNMGQVGTIPAGSFLIGGSSPNMQTTLVDYAANPVFVVKGYGAAVINGGYSGISQGGSVGGTNSNAFDFDINGCRGTGNGVPGDIVLQTGDSASSGTSVHSMYERWRIKGGSGFFTNSSAPTSAIDLTGPNGYSQFRMRITYTPTTSSDTHGNVGDFSWDGNYFYIKTPDGWKRSALTTF
ncbi:MAG TPA: hypothetical protein VHE34_28095 [Puia sp.]|uniref:hypothetical protein n=1 Tax=Puia sp. TaxID=2045100 RepID=UPI002B57771C|nr:hypothetical protein [Puia sp.]HVU99129.1 hypothetical protein [Puia sp.]